MHEVEEVISDNWEVIDKIQDNTSKNNDDKFQYFYYVKKKISQGRYLYKRCKRAYNFGYGGIKLFNRLFWMNYTVSPFCPPKVAVPLSILLVCIFIINNRDFATMSKNRK